MLRATAQERLKRAQAERLEAVVPKLEQTKMPMSYHEGRTEIETCAPQKHIQLQGRQQLKAAYAMRSTRCIWQMMIWVLPNKVVLHMLCLSLEDWDSLLLQSLALQSCTRGL